MLDIALMLLCFLVVHALLDFPLQGDQLSTGKGRFDAPYNGVPWWICLWWHCVIHAGGVALVVQVFNGDPRMVLGLAVVEHSLHWLIDYSKSRKKYGAVTDQVLHVACKVIYTVPLCLLPASDASPFL